MPFTPHTWITGETITDTLLNNTEDQHTQALADLRSASNNWTGTNNTFKKITSTVAMNANNDELLDMSSTVGTTGAGDTVRGINLALTNNPSGNINNCYGMDIAITNNSTQASKHYGCKAAFTNGGSIASGTPEAYGFYGDLQMTGLNGANAAVYGGYLKAGATSASGSGTLTAYGLYVANPTMSGGASRTCYGVYVENITAGGTNWAAYFAGGNVYVGGNINLGGTVTAGTWNAGAVTSSGNIISSSGSIGIGTASPGGPLHVTENTASTQTIIAQSSSASVAGATLRLRHSRGSTASPADVQNGDAVGLVTGTAYSGGTWFAGGEIDFGIDGTFTSGQRPPSNIQFFTNLANASQVERLRINSVGNTIAAGDIYTQKTYNGITMTSIGRHGTPITTVNSKTYTVSSDESCKILTIQTGDGDAALVYATYLSSTITFIGPSLNIIASASPGASQIGISKSANSHDIVIKTGSNVTGSYATWTASFIGGGFSGITVAP